MSKSSDNDYVIGIDLGTGNSCVAVMYNDKIEVITNSDGERTTPSFVAFTDTEKLVGLAAKNQYAMNPKNTVYEVKRLMGRKFADPEVQEDIKRFTYKVISSPEGYPLIEVSYKNKIEHFTPEQISAMILTKMKETAEDFLGQKVTRAVITVPAYFNDAQRQATKDAGIIAGLKVERLIAEPTSSVLAYGLNSKSTASKNVMIVDPGSGTYDVSIINVDDGVFEVKATSGNSHLGGSDFDAVLVEHFKKEFERKYKVSLSGNTRALGRLKTACERAKKTLSSSTSAQIEIDNFYEGIDYYSTISRARFEELSRDLLNKHMINVEKCLEDAKLDKSKIDEVVMTGGTSRIPKLCEMISEYFGGKSLNKSINPDECVAYGAAVQGDILSGRASKASENVLLLDVTPLSLGIETAGEVMTVIIPRNTTIPAKKTETNFSTYADNQTAVTISVYQGESSMTRHNTKLGEFNVTGIPPARRGVPRIEITFDIDANGILQVSAKETATGKSGNISITNNSSKLSKEDIEAAIKRAEEFKEDDDKIKAKIESKNKLESGYYQLKQQLEDAKLDKDPEFKEIMEIQSWLDEHPDETKEVYDKKYDDMMKVAQGIYAKMSSQPQNSQGQQTQNPNTQPQQPKGPKIEEVD